jgi:hypothetical protein
MAHLARPGACALCGDELELAPTELALIEGYELSLTNVTRTDEDDIDDTEEEYREPDPCELYGSFCERCAQKVKIDIERGLMRRIDAARKLADAGGAETEDDDAAPA